MDNFRKLLTPSEQNQLREDVLVWLKNFHVRVSLLLKLGFQDNEGNFVANNNSPIAQDMLRNLGENIYAVTQNGKVLERDQNDFVNPNGESCELQMFVEQILGKNKMFSFLQIEIYFYILFVKKCINTYIMLFLSHN